MRVVDYQPGLIVNSTDPCSITGASKLLPATTIGDCWRVGQTYFCKVQDPRGSVHIRALPRLEIRQGAA
jgi:hypothetical protein